MKQNYICEECGINFSRDNCGRNPRFCCKECFTNYKIKNRKHYNCKNCDKEFIRHNLDKNKTFCSVTCLNEWRRKESPWESTEQYKREYDKKYHMENKERIKEYKEQHKKEYQKAYRERWKKIGKTVGTRYSVYKSTSKRRNIEFNLTKEQFVELWNKPCHYCGSDIVGIGVDRVDNTIGYQVDNIVPCCSWCNRMKLNFTEQDFLNKCKQIVEFNNL